MVAPAPLPVSRTPVWARVCATSGTPRGPSRDEERLEIVQADAAHRLARHHDLHRISSHPGGASRDLGYSTTATSRWSSKRSPRSQPAPWFTQMSRPAISSSIPEPASNWLRTGGAPGPCGVTPATPGLQLGIAQSTGPRRGGRDQHVDLVDRSGATHGRTGEPT